MTIRDNETAKHTMEQEISDAKQRADNEVAKQLAERRARIKQARTAEVKEPVVQKPLKTESVSAQPKQVKEQTDNEAKKVADIDIARQLAERRARFLPAETIKKFEAQLDLIAKKRDELLKNGHKSASNCANKLHNDLTSLFEDLKRRPGQVDAFKDRANKAINIAHGELDKHRGWKELLVNIVCCITVIGILIKESINYYQGKSLFFVAKTNSAIMLDNTEELVKSLAPGN